MKRFILMIAALAGTACAVGADPVVDGKVSPGEYAHAQTLLGGNLVLSWQAAADGGLFVAVSAKTTGWVAVGLGATKMEGSTIYIGSVSADGRSSFSEDAGKGHGHAPAPAKTADQSAVGQDGQWTTLEIHIPAASLPFRGTSAPFIASYSLSKNLRSWHGLFNHASGTLDLR